MSDHIWTLRTPDGGASGLEFTRSLLQAHDVVLAHALPERVSAEVMTPEGRRVASAHNLAGGDATPMSRLEIEGESIRRRNIWPGRAELGLPVLLAGGEVGVLTAWWHADDLSEWRWSVEFHNHA